MSNFYPVRVKFEGITYYNAEAAYQAQKCRIPRERECFAILGADEAKKLGRRVPLRPDWEEVKLPVMEAVVRAKFTQNPYLAKYLAETGDQVLKEGNHWHDLYWGVDMHTGEGENHLGWSSLKRLNWKQLKKEKEIF